MGGFFMALICGSILGGKHILETPSRRLIRERREELHEWLADVERQCEEILEKYRKKREEDNNNKLNK